MSWFAPTPPARAELRRQLESLAGYNDKGFEWMRHTGAQIAAERARAMARVRAAAAAVGAENLPPALRDALASGAVETDASGRFVDLLDGA